jgi:hypothetical protein
VHSIKTEADHIESLLANSDAEILTLAALRARLALEMVCYERLRIAHDYISPDDLRRWQPKDVVNRLIEEVDPHIASSRTISIGKQTKAGEPAAQEDFIVVGHQTGFDARRLGKLWNGLGSFLHVRVPKTKADAVAPLGNPEDIESKVRETLEFLRDVEKGTMISTGMGRTVTFTCDCNAVNNRRADLLKHGQRVSCINPQCAERFDVEFDGSDVNFVPRSVEIECHTCKVVTSFPEKIITDLDRNQWMQFSCDCGASNQFVWKLMQAAAPEQGDGAQGTRRDEGPVV